MEHNKESDYPVDLSFDQLIANAVFHSDEIVSGAEVDLFDLGSAGSGVFDHEPGSIMNSLSEEEDESTENESCPGATTTTTQRNPKKQKVDRSRTLVSERKRRGRMKERLYALRALVPNITKMDKASIVADAVLYVQQLQMQAKKLKGEISDLETSLKDPSTQHNVVHHNYKKSPIARIIAPIPKTITQMDVFRVEEREFYIRLQSYKGGGVAISLYKALESLSQFVVRSSNLTTVGERFILTFTVGDCQEGLDVADVKMWIARAVVSQGFELRISGQ